MSKFQFISFHAPYYLLSLFGVFEGGWVYGRSIGEETAVAVDIEAVSGGSETWVGCGMGVTHVGAHAVSVLSWNLACVGLLSRLLLLQKLRGLCNKHGLL